MCVLNTTQSQNFSKVGDQEIKVMVWKGKSKGKGIKRREEELEEAKKDKIHRINIAKKMKEQKNIRILW